MTPVPPSVAVRVTVFVTAVLAVSGCELTEVSTARAEDVIVAESQVTVFLSADETSSAWVTASTLLHRTYGENVRAVGGSLVQVSGASGRTLRLVEAPLEHCLHQVDSLGGFPAEGSCYLASASGASFAPGEKLSLEINVPDGRVLTAVSRIPGTFSFRDLNQVGGRCRLEPNTNFRFRWTPAEDAWTYFAEANLGGLREALAGRDIDVPDSLYLVGLSLGREDTEIVFPRDFGLFNFLEEDFPRDLLFTLQDEGLPEGAGAVVSLAAADRNRTNWERGGNFNPSGEVRIPSVFGDGTGVFGTAVQRRISVTAGPGEEGELPLCGTAES